MRVLPVILVGDTGWSVDATAFAAELGAEDAAQSLTGPPFGQLWARAGMQAARRRPQQCQPCKCSHAQCQCVGSDFHK